MKRGIVVLGSIGMLVGCGLRDKADDVREEAKTRRELAGEWQQAGCPKSTVLADQFVRETIDFGTDLSFDRTILVYADAACDNLLATHLVQGTYKTEGDLDAGTTEFSFNVDEATITPESEESATLLNEQQFCGRTDWQAGVRQGVLDTECEGLTLTDQTELKDVMDIRDDKLYLGKPDFLAALAAPEATTKSVVLAAPFEKVQD